MARIRSILTLLVCASMLPSCATWHLSRWGTNHDSAFGPAEAQGIEMAIVRPTVTVVGLPFMMLWDAATFPFQVLFGVYPYGGNFLGPGAVEAVGQKDSGR